MATPPCLPFFHHLTAPTTLAGHRGFRACYPENTQASFSACLGRTALIELDVRLSADDQVVVIHDRHLDRTSNAKSLTGPCIGEDLLVRSWSLERLRRLDMGSWFLDQDPFGTLAADTTQRALLGPLMPQRIMTLAEVLAWAGKGHLLLNIELKSEADLAGKERLARKVVAAVYRAAMPHRVLLSSFDHHCLTLCRRLAKPNLALAALVEDQHPRDLLPYLQALGAAAYHCPPSLVDDGLVAVLHGRQMALGVYTVNDKEKQRDLWRMGVDIIFTDFL
jgi:glycerophosphoryl diester phosphodiesterase